MGGTRAAEEAGGSASTAWRRAGSRRFFSLNGVYISSYTEADRTGIRRRKGLSAMLNPHRVRAVERLLRAGKLSRRAIAAKLAVSRGTVSKIAARMKVAAQEGTDPAEDGGESPQVARCPNCGALVEMPCRACMVLRLREEGRLPPPTDESAGPLRLELRSPHYERYVAVRAAALARGETTEELLPHEAEPDEDPDDDWESPWDAEPDFALPDEDGGDDGWHETWRWAA